MKRYDVRVDNDTEDELPRRIKRQCERTTWQDFLALDQAGNKCTWVHLASSWLAFATNLRKEHIL